MKKALITGASSGIGKDIAIELSGMGYEIILVARNVQRLNEVSKQLKTKSYIIPADLSVKEQCFEVYERTMKICTDGSLEILINNAGFGLFGKFLETDITTEINMIDTNITAPHILTKLFLKEFSKNNSGYILNVASSAAFMPGPLMATYYATKAYVLRLTQAIDRELKNNGSKIYIGALCPGPVDTAFNDTANVSFALKGLESADVAKYAVKQMFRRKTVIIPGTAMKLSKFGLRFLPDKIITKIAYNIQKRKAE